MLPFLILVNSSYVSADSTGPIFPTYYTDTSIIPAQSIYPSYFPTSCICPSVIPAHPFDRSQLWRFSYLPICYNRFYFSAEFRICPPVVQILIFCIFSYLPIYYICPTFLARDTGTPIEGKARGKGEINY